MPSHYDDPRFLYPKYWARREYEHQSDLIALSKLLPKDTQRAIEIGGGFGRLTQKIAESTKKITLIEPSIRLRNMAKKYLGNIKGVQIISGRAETTSIRSESADLVILVRLLHHIPNPLPALQEAFRIIKPNGYLILEFANSTNFKAKLRSIVFGQPIVFSPLEKRSNANIRKKTIPFVNHHPQTIEKYLHRVGFEIKTSLSVSNLRLHILKKVIPLRLLLILESFFQTKLSSLYFGPSIYMLAKKIDKIHDP